jgi:putative acetyltransferase
MPIIRPEQPQDREAIGDVHRDAFGRSEEADLVDALRGSPAFIPELSLVAVAPDGRVVGHVLFTRIVVRDGPRAQPALALAPLAVLGSHQRRGVGAALTARGLERARELDHALVIVVGHPSYYPRFGFAAAGPHGIEAPFPVDDAAFMACELTPGALAGLRGMVEYPPQFGIESRLPPP